MMSRTFEEIFGRRSGAHRAALWYDPRNISMRHKQEKEMPETFSAIVKDVGIVKVAKAVVDRGIGGTISEQEFTDAVTDYAKRQFPNERTDVAFTKVFTGNSEEAATLRRAHAIIKNFPMMMVVAPTQVGGKDATAVDDPVDALAQLNDLAEEQRRRAPWMTPAQAFAAVYAATENAQLAAKERLQNRPRTTTINPGQ